MLAIKIDPDKKNQTRACLSILIAGLLTMAALIFPTTGAAKDFPLAWDPNCNTDPTLTGYTIYYSAGASVLADPDNANTIYIALNDPDFDPQHPAYTVSGLNDNTTYFFTVTAVYNDGESDMSNQISNTNTTPKTTSNTPSAGLSGNGNTTTTGSSGGGGCFITTLTQ
jgi:hypothetical protein